MNALRRLRQHPVGFIGAILVFLVVVMSLLAPALPIVDPAATELSARLLPPGSPEHLLGTDLLGRDILSRLVWGTLLSLAVALAATLIAAVTGSAIGLVAGYFGNRTDSILMRGIDVLMAFPYLLLALAIVAVLGPGLFNALVAIAVVNIPFFARTVRGATMGLVRRDFMDTARMSGRGEWSILAAEILPNVLPVIVITSATTLGWMILETAGLSFLGLGAQPPKVDLGSMLGESRKLLLVKPHLALLPGAVVFVVVMGINLLGDGLRDILDPRLSSGTSGRPSAATEVCLPDLEKAQGLPLTRPSATLSLSDGERAGVRRSTDPHLEKDSGDTPLLDVRSLTIGFGPSPLILATPGNPSWKPVVHGVSFHLKRGETLGLVGESGSGKSVTAHALLRLLPLPARIVGGSVTFQDQDLLRASPDNLRRLRGNRVGYIFQDPLASLNPMFTVGDQIAEVIRLHSACSWKEAWEESVALLDSLQIAHAADRAHSYPHELSGGMRQRVCIAMALANHPDLIIADEPTTALDVAVQRTVIDLLRESIRDSGTTLLFISHDLALVSELCERVLVMRRGEIVEQGATDKVLRSPRHPYTRGLLDSLPSATRAPESTDSTAPALISFKSVGKQFSQRASGLLRPKRPPFRALDSVSFDMPVGSAFGIVGESGSGKSTLARILCGLQDATQGEVRFDGRSIPEWMADPNSFRRRVQLVFQDPAWSLNPRKRIGDILKVPLEKLAGVKDRTEKASVLRSLLEKTGLPADTLERFPHEFSGGQAQRICIARALAAKPKVLVLDEAVSALDVTVQAQILELLRNLRMSEGLTLVFISHDLAVVRELCTHVAVLQGGHLVEHGLAAEVFDRPKIGYTRELLASRPAGFDSGAKIHPPK
jgi:ABC-type glutathione transport system ATPase component/ABC-type dipeptide/oligopeptide/nickel transport system permease subunit